MMYISLKTHLKNVLKESLANRNFLIMIIATIGMSPILIKVGGYYIYGDITTQMLPFVYETKRMFTSGVPFWSWNTYFGDNFIASYAYYTVFNPFTWINCLFPYKYLGFGFTFVLYLKFLLCGYVSQKYLKNLGFDEQLSLIGCMLYTFSSWAISNLCFYMFMEPMILFPFLLLFVERFLGKVGHQYTGLSMATFVVVTVNYYFSAINLIVATFYFFCRMFFLYKDGRERWLITMRAVGCVSLGIICASIVLIPVFLQLQGSPRVSLDSASFDITTIFYRIFWLLYPKTHEGRFFYLYYHEEWGSSAVSIAVFGLLPFILFQLKKGNWWIKYLAILLLILYITPLTGIFSVFTNYNYTRWAYALTLIVIICTLYYIKDYGMPRFDAAVWYCLIVYGMYILFTSASIYWQYVNRGNSAATSILMLALDMMLIVINAISLLIICRIKESNNWSFAATIIVVTVCLTMQFLLFSFPHFLDYSSDKNFFNETEYFCQGVDLKEKDDLWYRTDFSLNAHGECPSCNFGLICNRPSVETYHSIQNRRINKWNRIVGKSDLTRVFSPEKHVESFDALMSVKEKIVWSNEIADTDKINHPINKKEYFKILDLDHYIPMGFVYDQYVNSDTVEYLAGMDTNIDIPKVLLSALAIKEGDKNELRPFLKEGYINDRISLDSLISVRRSKSCDTFNGHTYGFDAHISLDSASVVFFSVVSDDGFTAYIDGKPTKIYDTNLGFSSVIVPAGSHDIIFRYFPPGLQLGILVTVIGLTIMGIIFLRKF